MSKRITPNGIHTETPVLVRTTRTLATVHRDRKGYVHLGLPDFFPRLIILILLLLVGFFGSGLTRSEYFASLQ